MHLIDTQPGFLIEYAIIPWAMWIAARWIIILGYDLQKKRKSSLEVPLLWLLLEFLILSALYFVLSNLGVLVCTLLTLNGQTGIFNNIIQCVSVLMAHFNSWFGV